MAKLSKKGALEVTSALDRVAEVFEKEFAAFGVSEKIARDFAFRCDLLADQVAKHAGFDPKEIGKEVPGSLEGDSDESFMKGEFTQQEHSELSKKVEGGGLGKQAGKLRRDLQAATIAGASPRILKALALAAKIAEEEEEEEEEEEAEEEAEGKKAGEMPPQFKENAEKKKEEAEAKKEEAKKAGELPDFIKEKKEKAEEEKDGKKASHGFNLFG